jgi:hypothetical protein
MTSAHSWRPYSPPRRNPPSPPPIDPEVEQRRALGLCALVAAVVGAVAGALAASVFLPVVLGLLAVVLGLFAVVLGVLSFGRARQGIGHDPALAWTGTVLGAGVILLGIWGSSVASGAVDSWVGAPPPTSAPAVPPPPPAVAFGQRAGWPDGTTVTVSAPRPLDPGAASNPRDVRYVAVTVTIVNGSQRNIDANGLVLAAKADGTEADRLPDSAKLTGTRPGTVRPGRGATFEAAFGLPPGAATNLEVQVKPNFGVGYQPAVFAGRL